jgi:hypothetical protein
MNPYPNFNPAQPYPPQGGLGFLKAMSTKAKLLIVGAVAVVGVVIIAVLAGGTHSHGPSAFLSELGDAGFYNEGGDSAELSGGYMVCDWLSAGSSRAAAADSFFRYSSYLFRYSSYLSHAKSVEFVDITDDYLC